MVVAKSSPLACMRTKGPDAPLDADSGRTEGGAAREEARHRIDQQRRPVYVGGPSQQQGAAPQPQGGIGGFLSSIGDSLSNVFSMFG